jgi:hypothetical protein
MNEFYQGMLMGAFCGMGLTLVFIFLYSVFDIDFFD